MTQIESKQFWIIRNIILENAIYLLLPFFFCDLPYGRDLRLRNEVAMMALLLKVDRLLIGFCKFIREIGDSTIIIPMERLHRNEKKMTLFDNLIED